MNFQSTFSPESYSTIAIIVSYNSFRDTITQQVGGLALANLYLKLTQMFIKVAQFFAPSTLWQLAMDFPIGHKSNFIYTLATQNIYGQNLRNYTYKFLREKISSLSYSSCLV